MQVLLVLSDTKGCGHYRLIYPMRALQAQGYDVQIVPPEALLPPDGDGKVVVIQRPLNTAVTDEAIPALRAMGYAVVVEIDDLISRLPHLHPMRNVVHPGLSPGYNWSALERACQVADLVTVTTPALEQFYAPHGRVGRLPNMVPADQIADAPREPAGTRYVGWTGGIHTHPLDLDQCKRGLKRNLRKPWLFKTIGYEDTLGYLGIYDGVLLPWVPIENYLRAMRGFDLGLAPLQVNHFNQAKSDLKPLEWAAAGVASVVSPTDPYLAFATTSSACLVADSDKSWDRAIGRLMRDDALRHDLAAAGLDYARTRTYEQHAWLWWEAWTRARELYEANYQGGSASARIPSSLVLR